MKILLKIIKRTFIALLGIVICLILTGFLYFKIFYVQEMNEIKARVKERGNDERDGRIKTSPAAVLLRLCTFERTHGVDCTSGHGTYSATTPQTGSN